jgi:hypothetical protein
MVQRRNCRMMSSLSLSSPLRCRRSCSDIGLLCVSDGFAKPHVFLLPFRLNYAGGSELVPPTSSDLY